MGFFDKVGGFFNKAGNGIASGASAAASGLGSINWNDAFGYAGKDVSGILGGVGSGLGSIMKGLGLSDITKGFGAFEEGVGNMFRNPFMPLLLGAGAIVVLIVLMKE